MPSSWTETARAYALLRAHATADATQLIEGDEYQALEHVRTACRFVADHPSQRNMAALAALLVAFDKEAPAATTPRFEGTYRPER